VGQWWHLWQAWFSGEQVAGADLWGLPLLVWARTGKVLQFLAGMTVVLDLIGPDPLRAFGRRLQKVPWSRGFTGPAEVLAVVVLTVSLLGYVVFIVLLFTDLFPFGKPVTSAILAPVRHGLGWLGGQWWGSCLCMAVIGLAVLLHHLTPRAPRNQVGLAVRLDWLLWPAVIVGLLAVALLLLPWALVIYGFCLPVSHGLAALLDRTQPAHPLRWVAFGLFVAGFHFDLLAS